MRPGAKGRYPRRSARGGSRSARTKATSGARTVSAPEKETRPHRVDATEPSLDDVVADPSRDLKRDLPMLGTRRRHAVQLPVDQVVLVPVGGQRCQRLGGHSSGDGHRTPPRGRIKAIIFWQAGPRSFADEGSTRPPVVGLTVQLGRTVPSWTLLTLSEGCDRVRATLTLEHRPARQPVPSETVRSWTGSQAPSLTRHRRLSSPGRSRGVALGGGKLLVPGGHPAPHRIRPRCA